MKTTLIGPFTQIITMRGLPLKGSLADEQLEIIENGGILIAENGIISAIDHFENLERLMKDDFKYVPIPKHSILIPGLIDCHTHTCYAGSRKNDFAMRLAGKSYLDIAKAGGGIMTSVVKTREASQEYLQELMLPRLQRMAKEGITTCEIKTGYGLNIEDEIKMARAIESFKNTDLAISIVPTCLVAHLCPPEYASPERYLEEMARELLPKIYQETAIRRVDIFVEETAFDVNIAKKYLQKAQGLGFDITIHADQFHTGGSALAVALNAKSADHLEASTDLEIGLLAKSNTVAVALPGASIGLGCAFAPARRLLDAGACVAIASDFNPGSAPTGNLLLQASILGMYEKLNTAELLAGITYRAAQALGLQDRGVIAVGKRANFTILATDDYRDIFYQASSATLVKQTFVAGIQ